MVSYNSFLAAKCNADTVLIHIRGDTTMLSVFLYYHHLKSKYTFWRSHYIVTTQMELVKINIFYIILVSNITCKIYDRIILYYIIL